MTKTLSPTQAAALLASGEAVLIDVREPDEFKNEHIACALSVPLSRLDELMKTIPLPAGRKIIFQCYKGKRGEQACDLTGQSRADETYNIDGGIEGWKKAGLSTTGAASRLSIFRQVQIIVGALVAASIWLGFVVSPVFFGIAGFLGVALFTAGVTGWCGLALLLGKLPWNKA